MSTGVTWRDEAEDWHHDFMDRLERRAVAVSRGKTGWGPPLAHRLVWLETWAFDRHLRRVIERRLGRFTFVGPDVGDELVRLMAGEAKVPVSPA